MLVFRKIWRTYLIDDPFLNSSKQPPSQMFDRVLMIFFRVLKFLGVAEKELSKEKPISYSQSNFGLIGVKMKKNVFDRRIIDVDSNRNVEVNFSSSKKNSKESDIFHVINVELPTNLPQDLNNNESDLNIVAISYKTDKLFVRLKRSSSKCKAFYFFYL